MPERETMERAQQDAREGKSPSTQAGEFVREEMHHIREGKHGARSTQQAIAIGLSKARRAGVKLKAPKALRRCGRKLRKIPKPAISMANHWFGLWRSDATINLPASSVCNDSAEN